MRLWLACFIVIAGGACDSPTAPDIDCVMYSRCTATNPSPLSYVDETSAINEARYEVATELRKFVTPSTPSVQYDACPFFVRNSTEGDVCANGVTYQSGIRVATWQGHAQTRALVKWEAKNWYYIQAGRRDLAR